MFLMFSVPVMETLRLIAGDLGAGLSSLTILFMLKWRCSLAFSLQTLGHDRNDLGGYSV